MDLVPYGDDDIELTYALETDPEVMRELGGPITRERILAIHPKRVDDPWWLKIVPEAGGPAVGTIGIWEKRLDGERIHETGWMLLPAYQGRGIATAALALLLARACAEPRFERLHAFPVVTNARSNALCRKFGFSLVGERDFDFAGRSLRCNVWALDLGRRGLVEHRQEPAARPLSHLRVAIRHSSDG